MPKIGEMPEGWEKGDKVEDSFPYIVNWNARSKDDTLEGLCALSMSIHDKEHFDAWLKWFRS